MRRDSFEPFPKPFVAVMAACLVPIWVGVVLLVLLFGSSLLTLLAIPSSGMFLVIPLVIRASARKEPRNNW